MTWAGCIFSLNILPMLSGLKCTMVLNELAGRPVGVSLRYAWNIQAYNEFPAIIERCENVYGRWACDKSATSRTVIYLIKTILTRTYSPWLNIELPEPVECESIRRP